MARAGEVRRKRTLADRLAAAPGVSRATAPTLTPTGGVTRGSSVGAPKKGYQFVQKHGPRAGQSFSVKRGASGKAERVYETGDTADATGPKLKQVGATAAKPSVLKQQQQESTAGDVAEIAKRYAKILQAGKRTYRSRAKSAQMKLAKVRVPKKGAGPPLA